MKGVATSMNVTTGCVAGIIAFSTVALCASLLFPSCASQSEWATRVAWPDVDAAHVPGPAEYPDAGAIILLDEGKMEVFGGGIFGFSAFDEHRIVKVLNTRGHRFANVAIPYATGSQVDNIQARTISSSGKITVLDEKNIFDVSLYPNFVFFSDQRAKIFTLPAVDDGSVIEYRYTLTMRGRSLWHSWNFQNEAPTLLSRFTVIKPGEWEFGYRTYNIDVQPQIVKAPGEFKSTYVWQARDVPALRSEFGMPPRSERSARLALSPVGFKTWGDVSQWYNTLASPKMNAGPGIRSLALQLTAGEMTNEEKLRHLFEWVRDRVRYVAVEIGIGGYQPHEAEEILTNQYGDCKDMVTLLCSLGKEAGLDMRQVLVSTRDNGMPDTSLPSPLHFNHAIAYCPSVGNRGTWMDATDKGCLYGHLPWYDQRLPVLITGEKGEEQVVQTPGSVPDSNQDRTEWRIALQPSGGARVEGVSTYRGAAGAELRDELVFASPHERRLWLETLLAKECSGVFLDTFRIAGVDTANDPLTVSYAFHTSTLATRRDNALVIQPGNVSGSVLTDYLRSPDRMYPVRFRYGNLKVTDLAISLQQGWVTENLPFSDSLVSPFGSAHWQRTNEGGLFHIRSRFMLRGDDIPPGEYRKFQEFLDGVREKDLREAVILPGRESAGSGAKENEVPVRLQDRHR